MWLAGEDVVLTFERSGDPLSTAFLQLKVRERVTALMFRMWRGATTCSQFLWKHSHPWKELPLYSPRQNLVCGGDSMDGNGWIFFFPCRCKINTMVSNTHGLCNFYCQFQRVNKFSPHSWLWNKMFEILKKAIKKCAKNFQAQYIILHIYIGEILYLCLLHLLITNLLENELSVQNIFLLLWVKYLSLQPFILLFCF